MTDDAPSLPEPMWLGWAREIQAIAQNGLAFAQDPYDRERYEALRHLAARIAASRSDADMTRIAGLFAGETGYATPKIDVRGAVFDADGRILMVRETSDAGRWTLPGGWADVNLSAAENVVKEVREESGYVVRATSLAAVLDRTRQRHPYGVFSCYKMFFVCALEGGAAATSLETSEIGWFAEQEVPEDLSLARVLPRQIADIFRHRSDPGMPTRFD